MSNSLLTTDLWMRGNLRTLRVGRCIWCYGDPCHCYNPPTPLQADMFQNYWRCEHHPNAIENFFKPLAACELCNTGERV
jgi:hypothetical protein